jgi:hypothetical protein
MEDLSTDNQAVHVSKLNLLHDKDSRNLRIHEIIIDK